MSFEQIWEKYRGALKGYLNNKISHPDEVDDLLQEILIKTYLRLDSLDSVTSLKPWLFKIAHNTVIDYYRKFKPELVDELDSVFVEELDDIHSDLSACILPFIQSLPIENADLLMAIDINQVSQKDYAEQQGVSYSTLKSRVQKSRQMLKESYDNCCHFYYDHQGNLMDYESKTCNKNC